MKKYVSLLRAILICEGVGVLGSVFTVSNIPTWYAGLNKPTFSPPNWVFGPVWTLLYFLMGVALFLVWRKKIPMIFSLQLILNFVWSVVFFGMRSPLGGLIVIVLLWLAILGSIINFWKISRWAGILLIPYLGWVTFASILNYNIFILN